jgi:hypothetical protein
VRTQKSTLPGEKKTTGTKPTGDEVNIALAEWVKAEELYKEAYNLMMDKRAALVDVLHRAGLQGFSL